MPAPPLESEPAMVTAIGVAVAAFMAPAASRRRLRRATMRPGGWHLGGVGSERRINNGAQLAGSGLRIGAVGQRRDHGDAVGTCRDHWLGIRRRDSRDAARGKVTDATAQDLNDLAQPIEADRGFTAGL